MSALDSFLAQVKDETMKISETEREAEFVKSEVLMYRNEVLMETPGGEKLEEAYEDLCSFEADALDRDEWLWRKGRLELKRGMYADAEATFLSMLKDGQTEDYRVHAGYQCALLKLEGEKLDAIMALDGMDTPLAKVRDTRPPASPAPPLPPIPPSATLTSQTLLAAQFVPDTGTEGTSHRQLRHSAAAHQ